MIQECLEVFKKKLAEEGERFFLDSYLPKDGTYLMVFMDDAWSVGEPLDIIYRKKDGGIEGKNSLYYEEFCYLDYYSKLITMNKPIDSKKIIHSNNYLSFFIKKDSLSNGKLTMEVIDGYYEILKNPWIKYKKGNVAALYKEVEDSLGIVDVETAEAVQKWIKTHLNELKTAFTGTDYLKLFFVYRDMEKTREVYKREGQRYVLPNIYNNNDYNIVVDGKIMGLPNDNMGMNAKKPYLANKSRRVQVPYLLNREDVMLQAKFYEYLMGCAAQERVNIYIDAVNMEIWPEKSGTNPRNVANGYFLRLRKGKEVEIHNVDTIVDYNPNLKGFRYQPMIPTENHAGYEVLNKKCQLEWMIDRVFFDRKLIDNYFTEPGELRRIDGTIVCQMLRVREVLFSYFYKNNGADIWAAMKQPGFVIVKSTISRGMDYWKHARNQLNLLWSMEDYFTGTQRRKMTMNTVEKEFTEHLNTNEAWEFSGDAEYYFAVGQMVAYFLIISKAKKKALSFVNPFINAKEDKMIKERLVTLFLKYNYDMELRYATVRRLYSKIMLYQPEGKVNTEMISAGVTADSMLFGKNKDNLETVEEE